MWGGGWEHKRKKGKKWRPKEFKRKKGGGGGGGGNVSKELKKEQQSERKKDRSYIHSKQVASEQTGASMHRTQNTNSKVSMSTITSNSPNTKKKK